jgi:hypothetical protein
MQRTAAPLAVAVAVSLACPAVWAAPIGSPLASRVPPAAAAPAPEATSEPAPYPPPPDPNAAPPPPAPEGPPPPVAAPPPEPIKRRKGLMIAGWSMFGGSYLFTALIAGIVYDTCNVVDAPQCRRAAGFSLIPVIGPFLTIPNLNTDAITPKIFMAIPGLVQAAGLAMGIAGTIQFVNDGKRQQIAGVDGFRLGNRLRLGMQPTRFLDGGTFTLGGRF